MIVLKLPPFITVALILIVKETTSAGLNKRNIDNKSKLLLHGVSLPPSGTRHWRGLRALQDECNVEKTAADYCVKNTATASACFTCINAENNKAWDNSESDCQSFEDNMCNALKVICSPSCDACINELEAFYACNLLSGSFGLCADRIMFDCSSPDIPITPTPVCAAQLTDVDSCVSKIANSSACNDCIADEKYMVVGDNIAMVSCQAFEDGMCNALKVVCSSSCDGTACYDEMKAFYACELEKSTNGKCDEEDFDCGDYVGQPRRGGIQRGN